MNELRVHPLEPELFVSGSMDESLRLWNGVSGVCVLVLGGARGHRNEVLSAVSSSCSRNDIVYVNRKGDSNDDCNGRTRHVAFARAP